MIFEYSSPVAFQNSRNVNKFFNGSTFIVQEKVDGSQFSFGVIDGVLCCRSHEQQINLNNPGMFDKAVETVKNLYDAGLLVDNYIYRCEYLRKQKHTRLCYDRVPQGYLVLFDIQCCDHSYLTQDTVKKWAELAGVDYAPVLSYGMAIPTQDELDKWLATPSVLGGKIEGVVFKNYAVYAQNGTYMMLKYVSSEFKESKSGKVRSTEGVVQQIVEKYNSEARFHKAVQHVKEADMLVNDVQDIGPLMRELVSDFELEACEEIKDILWKYYRKDILRGVTGAFPFWYKGQLAKDTQDE